MDLHLERPSVEAEKRRQKREFLIIAVLIVTVGIISYAISKTSNYGADFPISNTLLMFILININMMLLLTLIILVFRNLTKLYFDRRKKAMGSKLRVKLVIAFISLTLVPSVVLFYFSMQFISNSIAYWFNAPVEQALENSLSIGRELYNHIEKNNAFFLDRTAYQLDKKYLDSKKKGPCPTTSWSASAPLTSMPSRSTARTPNDSPFPSHRKQRRCISASSLPESFKKQPNPKGSTPLSRRAAAANSSEASPPCPSGPSDRMPGPMW